MKSRYRLDFYEGCDGIIWHYVADGHDIIAKFKASSEYSAQCEARTLLAQLQAAEPKPRFALEYGEISWDVIDHEHEDARVASFWSLLGSENSYDIREAQAQALVDKLNETDS